MALVKRSRRARWGGRGTKGERGALRVLRWKDKVVEGLPKRASRSLLSGWRELEAFEAASEGHAFAGRQAFAAPQLWPASRFGRGAAER
jgi:hypothetical protein